MNRILLEPGELDGACAARLEGPRAGHVLGVLRARPGDIVRVGILGGAVGVAEVTAVEPGAVRLLCRLDAGPPPAPPPIDLVLAMPRPKVMRRLWAALAQFAPRRIVVVNAARVEKGYFETPSLDPAEIRVRLIEGLAQAGGTVLPQVEIRRRLRPFVEDELDALCPGPARLIAHPAGGRRVADALGGPVSGAVLAVGPEGGWVPFELELFEARGFSRVAVATGPLRSDVACIALLALLRDRLAAG